MIRRIVPPLVFALAALIVWELACYLFEIPTYILPTPRSIGAELSHSGGMLVSNAAATLWEALLGFVIANVLAILLAMAMVYIRHLDRAVMPFAIALKTTPIVAMAPLLLLWLGNGIAPKVASAALICFFPVLVNAIKGFTALEEGEEDLFRIYGASRTAALFKLRFYRAAPYIFSALKVSSSLAVVGAIVGEFVGANRGIGYVILVASYHLETARMFAALVVAAAAGVGFYLVLSYLDRKLIFWQPLPTDEIRMESPRSRTRRSSGR